MKRITDKELTEAFEEFDKDLELDEEKIAELPDKQKSELYLAIQKVLKYREDFPPDLADAVQQLAKQSVEKQGIKGSPSDLGLDPDEDGIVLDDGTILDPGDEMFPIVKKLSQMSEQEVTDYVDNIAEVVTSCCQTVMVKLLDKRLGQIEKERGITKDYKQDDKDKGKKWPTVVQQM